MSIFNAFRQYVVSSDGAVQQAIADAVPSGDVKEYIKSNFSSLVSGIQEETYRIYRESERKAGERAIREYLASVVPLGSSRSGALDAIADQFPQLDKFFLSLTNSRRSRAGSAFQVTIRVLFRYLGYPFQEQQVIDGKPDFILPSKGHFRDNAMDCIVFTVKRTLRERWRQIISEGAGTAFYLATIDDGLSPEQLRAIRQNRIFVVVPERIKRSRYLDALNVISFEDFFSDHLDPAVRRWKHGVVV